MRTLVAVLGLIGVAFATTGFDASQSVSQTQFTCLAKEGYEFFIARVYKSYGAVDTVGIQNIVNARAAGWKYVDGYLFPCPKTSCRTAALQVNDAVYELNTKGATIGILWLDVEIYNWGTDLAWNRQFILDMVAEAKKLNVKVGIYTNKNNWSTIVGAWTGVSDLQLWWATYNHDPSFAGFGAFGGWTKPNIHQYEGDYAGPCSVAMDLNYY